MVWWPLLICKPNENWFTSNDFFFNLLAYVYNHLNENLPRIIYLKWASSIFRDMCVFMYMCFYVHVCELHCILEEENTWNYFLNYVLLVDVNFSYNYIKNIIINMACIKLLNSFSRVILIINLLHWYFNYLH